MLSSAVVPALELTIPVQTAGMPLEVLPFILTALAIITGGVLMLIPVSGFTARFALKPVIEQIIRLRDTDARRREVLELQARVSLLEQHLLHLGHPLPTSMPVSAPNPELMNAPTRADGVSGSREELDAELSRMAQLRGHRIGSGEA